jgi:hypothetical protein
MARVPKSDSDNVGVSGRYKEHGVQVNVALIVLAVMLSLGSSGPEQNDLLLSIAHIETANSKPSTPEFAITLENEREGDLVLLLGTVVGGKLYPHAITLQVSDERGHTSGLRFRGPFRVGGRIDPYLVGMPSHATYVLRVSLEQYSRPYTGEGRTIPPTESKLDPELPPGTYTIQATLEGPTANSVASDGCGNPLMNRWTGSVSSNVLRFVIPH